MSQEREAAGGQSERPVQQNMMACLRLTASCELLSHGYLLHEELFATFNVLRD